MGRWSAPEWCSVGERGDGERLWVSVWCLREVFAAVDVETRIDRDRDRDAGIVCMFITVGPMKKL